MHVQREFKVSFCSHDVVHGKWRVCTEIPVSKSVSVYQWQSFLNHNFICCWKTQNSKMKSKVKTKEIQTQ